MSHSRERILTRIHAALADLGDARDGDVRNDPKAPAGYRRRTLSEPGQLLEEFVERVCDYKATVERVGPAQLAQAVSAACRELGAARLLAPPALAADLAPDGVEMVADSGLSFAELDRIGTVLTGCAVAIAQTGTIVLDGGQRSGRRALTLIPDRHICIVMSDQVVGLVPEAFDRLASVTAGGAHRPITFVSGPSATSDIELSRVEGIHGPRRLHVLLIDGSR